MASASSALSPVHLAPHAFRIHGKPEIVLCASLFYFRIPREHWRERMTQLKSFGYNCIDVYFPWNYHEPEQGVWDFDGEKDIAAFLQTAKDVGLWVVARPGPYICSEWDGGALPAYLLAVDGMKLRDHDPVFLQAVSRWYDKVLALLKPFQITEGGTVLCVQLDNELDFYGCADPHGYISALRDMAVSRGITVPLIACAGQGSLPAASGLAEGVVPTCNFYPHDRDPQFEEKVLHYKELLAEMGYPLLVTETNRTHFLLRRLLSCGVKLLGPYLQVSGTDFGFTNATNNWGAPLAFLTSDYDFGGMISPEGHVRPEAYEGRMLARLIEAYGPSLAEAEPAASDAVRTAAAPQAAAVVSRALKLGGGGYLAFVSNVGESEAEVTLETDALQAPRRTKFAVGKQRSLALPVGVPLRPWGMEGTLLYATAELFYRRQSRSLTVLAFHTDGEGEVALRVEQPALHEIMNMTAEEKDGAVTLTFGSDVVASCRIALADGHTLVIVAMGREKALLVEDIGEDGALRLGTPAEYVTDAVDVPVRWSFHSVPADAPMSGAPIAAAEQADFLEAYGIYRGFAWYETSIDPRDAAACKGLLVRQASDVVSVYIGNRYIATVVPGGSSRYIPIEPAELSEPAALDGRITVRTEIWGHSNFDDLRLPGLRLNAKKGLNGIAAVTRIIDLSRNWKAKPVRDRTAREEFIGAAADDRLWPIVGFGGWLPSEVPALEYYRKSFEAAEGADFWAIHFDGMIAMAHVYVNGHDAGRIVPSDPYADITAFVRPGKPVQVTVLLERTPGASAGKVTLYEGVSLKNWRISACREDDLWERAQAAFRPEAPPLPANSARPQEGPPTPPVRGEEDREMGLREPSDRAARNALPAEMNAGEMAWLLGELADSNGGKGWRVRVQGANMKLTALFNGQVVGRIWLPGSRARPEFRGGRPDSFYVPGPWFRNGANRLAILLEALDGESPSRLVALEFIPVGRIKEHD